MTSVLARYLSDHDPTAADAGLIGYLAALEQVAGILPEVARAIIDELADQRANLKLIASENYCSLATQAAMGNLLTDKYAEGYPEHRFYAGCDNVDRIESRAIELAKQLFGCDHAYVQPHSGADANLIAYWAILATRVEVPALQAAGVKGVGDLDRGGWSELRAHLGNQRLLGMDYSAGGHLTHGYALNVSGRMFESYGYGVDADTGLIDYDRLAAQAAEVRPLVLVAGYSAYPRRIDFVRMRRIADDVGAVLMVDMAHFAGLVAGGVFSGDYDPMAHADVVTTTTHKTLRGPRGGMVMCRAEFAAAVDKGCPLVIGGPLPHVVAAKAVAFAEAARPEFRAYAQQIVANAQRLAEALVEAGQTVATGGTDNHLLLLDVTPRGLNGRLAETAVRQCGITLNRNALPNDANGPWYTSGLRLGTPALTTLGMGEAEMSQIGALIARVLQDAQPATITKGPRTGAASRSNVQLDAGIRDHARQEVAALLARFPVYPELDLSLLRSLLD
jgi:glycine hydroxymethyltransferase